MTVHNYKSLGGYLYSRSSIQNKWAWFHDGSERSDTEMRYMKSVLNGRVCMISNQDDERDILNTISASQLVFISHNQLEQTINK